MKDLIKHYLFIKMTLPITQETVSIDKDILLLKKKNIKYDEIINRLDNKIKFFLKSKNINC